jgi:hypothetical protein
LIVFRDDLNYVIIYYNYIEMSDPVCVKLIDDDAEFKGIKIKDPSVKIAIKAGDKYTITDSNQMDGTEFEKDSMYAQVDAPAATNTANDAEGDGDTPVDGDGDADKAAAERKRLEEEAERKRLEAEEELTSNVTHDSDDETVDSEITNKSSDTTVPSGGGKRRKSTKRGRKSTRKGRKSSGKGRKSRKKGRRGKGSRRSKK